MWASHPARSSATPSLILENTSRDQSSTQTSTNPAVGEHDSPATPPLSHHEQSDTSSTPAPATSITTGEPEPRARTECEHRIGPAHTSVQRFVKSSQARVLSLDPPSNCGVERVSE